MKIWAILEGGWLKTAETKQLELEAKSLGIKFEKLQPSKFEIIASKSKIDNPGVYYQGRAKKLPAAVLTRCGSSTKYFTLAILRHLMQQGVLVVNEVGAIEKARDKLQAAQILAAHNIPTPKTMLAKSPLSLGFIEEHFSYPMLIKKVSGSKGKGVVLVNNRDELDDIMGLFEETNIHNPNLIIQEFIAGSRGKDIRVLVIGGKVIGAMLRQAKGGSFKANFSRGGSVEAIELTPAMEWLAIESTRILNLEIAGVDLLFDGDNYQVCEVNAAPGFEGFSKAHPELNVAREILQYLQVRLGKN